MASMYRSEHGPIHGRGVSWCAAAATLVVCKTEANEAADGIPKANEIADRTPKVDGQGVNRYLAAATLAVPPSQTKSRSKRSYGVEANDVCLDEAAEVDKVVDET